MLLSTLLVWLVINIPASVVFVVKWSSDGYLFNFEEGVKVKHLICFTVFLPALLINFVLYTAMGLLGLIFMGIELIWNKRIY